MQPRASHYAILVLSSLLALSLPAADPCDPYASLDRRHSIACLAALRAPLDAAPDDAHLLGLAIQAYANLCLEILPDDCGIYGPWFGYAQELTRQRIALRQGREPATLAEAAPELWLRIVDGDTRSVEAAVQRYPAEVDTPQARALHAAATRDHRAVVLLARPTAHESFAGCRAIRATSELGPMADRGLRNINRSTFEHLIVRKLLPTELRWIEEWRGNNNDICCALIADTAWMMSSTSIDDETARRELDDLLQALRLPAGTDQRGALQAKVMAAARNNLDDSTVRADAVASAIRIVLAHRNGPAGIRDESGKHRLVGLGDVARWMSDRFLRHAIPLPDRPSTQSPGEYRLRLSSILPEKAPGSLHAALGRLYGFADQEHCPEGTEAAVFAGILKELDQGMAPGLLIQALSAQNMLYDSPERRAMFSRIEAAQKQKGRFPLREGLLFFTHCCEWLKYMDNFSFRVLTALHRDPWEVQFRNWRWLTWDTARCLSCLNGIPPKATWIDATVDNVILPWPHLDASNDLFIRWQGWLRIDQPGTYGISIESDDDSCLDVGDYALFNPEVHGMKRMEMTEDFNAGWIPVTISYHQGQGDAGCRLRWQPPGAKEWSVIPAERLAHGTDHMPGLVATGWAGSKAVECINFPSDAEVAGALAMPWHVAFLTEMAHRCFEAGRLQDVLNCAEAALKITVVSRSQTRLLKMLALFGLDATRIDEALALILDREFAFNDDDIMIYCLYHLRRAGKLEALIPRLHREMTTYKPFIPRYARFKGSACLDAGDLPAALDWLDKAMGKPSLYKPASDRVHDLLVLLVFKRMYGKDTAATEALASDCGDDVTPAQRLAMDCLLGHSAWQQAASNISQDDADQVLYFQAWNHLAEGRHEDARKIFIRIATDHTSWTVAATARGIAAWITGLTPEQQAQLPKAKPIVPTPAPPSRF